jgi:hypothetical protein
MLRLVSDENINGDIVVNDRLPVRQAIDELLLVDACSQ